MSWPGSCYLVSHGAGSLTESRYAGWRLFETCTIKAVSWSRVNLLRAADSTRFERKMKQDMESTWPSDRNISGTYWETSSFPHLHSVTVTDNSARLCMTVWPLYIQFICSGEHTNIVIWSFGSGVMTIFHIFPSSTTYWLSGKKLCLLALPCTKGGTKKEAGGENDKGLTDCLHDHACDLHSWLAIVISTWNAQGKTRRNLSVTLACTLQLMWFKAQNNKTRYK